MDWLQRDRSTESYCCFGKKAGVFQFTFQLARDAFRSSVLTLSSVLYEADGLAVVGGGEKCRLHLKGFQPGGAPKGEQ